MYKLIPVLLLLLLFPLSSLADTARFKDSESNVRSGPSAKFPVLVMPPAGTEAELLKVDNQWLQIQFNNGKTGWVHKSNVEVLSADAAPRAIAVKEFSAGNPAVIHHVLLKQDDWGTSYRLRIEVNKKIFWEDKEGRFPLFIGDGGVEEIAFAGDLDHDGSPDLLLSDAQSDVGPASFRWLHYEEGRFVQVLQNSLLTLERDSQTLQWSTPPDQSGDICWLMKFQGLEAPGLVRAELWRFHNERLETSRVVLSINRDGAQIERTISEFKEFEQ